MHAGVIGLLHATLRDERWVWEPGIVAPLLVAAGLYAQGARTLWSSARGRGVAVWEAGCFAAGWVTLALALVSPLHTASEQIFSAHMIQHELLMVVAAPLLLLGRPALVMLWAFPLRVRQRIGGVSRGRVVRTGWQTLTRPFDAWLVHAAAIWCWHIPALFQATLRSETVHALQHLSFLGSALLFWWAVIHPRRRAALGLSIVYLFTTAVHTAVLGALMTFSRTPWYPAYAGGAAAWGLTPIEDQQAAGLIMWIPASLAYLVAALFILRRWLQSSEQDAARRERAAMTHLTFTTSSVR